MRTTPLPFRPSLLTHAIILVLLVIIISFTTSDDNIISNNLTSSFDLDSESKLDLSYKGIVVFGDSLSDDGSGSWRLTNHTWPSDRAYLAGHFSNGLLWVEYLARWIQYTQGGISVTSRSSGKEYQDEQDDNFFGMRKLDDEEEGEMGESQVLLDDRAYGGATLDNARIQGRTGYHSDIPVPSVKDQVQLYLEQSKEEDLTLYSRNLFIVGGGGNDGYFALLARHNLSSTALESSSILLEQVNLLISKRGARHILLPAHPDLSLCPYSLEVLNETDRLGLQRYADLLFQHLQMGVEEILKRHERERIHGRGRRAGKMYIALVDQGSIYSLPSGESEFGLTFRDTTTPCLRGVYPGVDDGVRSVCDEPDQHLFWDAFHLTTKGHEVLARKAVEALHSIGDPLVKQLRGTLNSDLRNIGGMDGNRQRVLVK